MLPLLGLLPTIFSAVDSISDIFDSGKKVVQAVTGKSSDASTPDELKKEVQALPPEQQAAFAEKMKAEIEMYEAQTKRLNSEQGTFSGNVLLSKVSQQQADEVAHYRMTTRPWAVRLSMYFILFPVFLAVIDAAQRFLVVWVVQPLGALLAKATGFVGMMNFDGVPLFAYVFGVNLNDKLSDGTPAVDILQGSVMGALYVDTVQFLVPIVVGYMGLREVGKWREEKKQAKLPNLGSGVGGSFTSTLNQVAQAADESASVISQIRKAANKILK